MHCCVWCLQTGRLCKSEICLYEYDFGNARVNAGQKKKIMDKNIESMQRTNVINYVETTTKN